MRVKVTKGSELSHHSTLLAAFIIHDYKSYYNFRKSRKNTVKRERHTRNWLDLWFFTWCHTRRPTTKLNVVGFWKLRKDFTDLRMSCQCAHLLNVRNSQYTFLMGFIWTFAPTRKSPELTVYVTLTSIYKRVKTCCSHGMDIFLISLYLWM